MLLQFGLFNTLVQAFCSRCFKGAKKYLLILPVLGPFFCHLCRGNNTTHRLLLLCLPCQYHLHTKVLGLQDTVRKALLSTSSITDINTAQPALESRQHCHQN